MIKRAPQGHMWGLSSAKAVVQQGLLCRQYADRPLLLGPHMPPCPPTVIQPRGLM